MTRAEVMRYVEKLFTDRWQDTCDLRGYRRIGVGETVLETGVERLQADAFVRGELDWCDGCMALVAPFAGPHCSGCEHCAAQLRKGHNE